MSNGSKRFSESAGSAAMTDDSDPLQEMRRKPDPRDPRADSLLLKGAPATDGYWMLLGLPYDGGIPTRPGARFGPAALRRALSAFTPFDGDQAVWPLIDLGDLDLTLPADAAHERIEEATRRLFAGSSRLVSIGGDHGCTGSIIRGLAAARPDRPISIVSIDAHLDVREYAESAIGSGTPFRRALELENCAGSRTAMIGIRPFANSDYYTRWARDHGVRLTTVDEVAREGAVAIAEEVLRTVAPGEELLYLSIDLDAADGAYAPGVSAPGIGGLSAREMIDIVSTLAIGADLVGVDLMELSPPLDQDDRTARLAARLLLEVLRSAPAA